MVVNKVQEVSFHRNGICGSGFHAILFTSDIDGTSEEEAKTWNVKASPAQPDAKFLGIVFDEPGSCAVICLDLIAEDGVKFGANSWRGDRFEEQLRKAIEENQSSGSIRVGPFAIPTE